jgi:hypothetical protein
MERSLTFFLTASFCVIMTTSLGGSPDEQDRAGCGGQRHPTAQGGVLEGGGLCPLASGRRQVHCRRAQPGRRYEPGP